MAAPAFALLWADQSAAAPFRAGQSPGATVFAGFCASPASLVACLFIINENGPIGRELRYRGFARGEGQPFVSRGIRPLSRHASIKGRAVRGLVVAFRPWLGRPGQVVVVRKSDQPHEREKASEILRDTAGRQTSPS